MVKVQLDLIEQMELDDKLEIVWERKQYGFENTDKQITRDHKGSCNKEKVGNSSDFFY
jgi:hypothetical protein